MVAEWFPERERALASGIFNSGSAVGAILAPPAIVWIVLRFGWPASFLAVGACVPVAGDLVGALPHAGAGRAQPLPSDPRSR